VTLKADWTNNGSITGVADNQLLIEYSLNGGGAWNTLLLHLNVTSLANGTASQALSNSQDLTTVRVRDSLLAETGGAGDSASITATVSNIKIEVVTVDANVIVMM